MPRIFTIPPDMPFLPALARAILGGEFPHEGITRPDAAALARWTILVPTRRAARALEEELIEASGADTLLMPAIRPIGDIDEEDISFDDLDMPEAIPALGREYLLARLVDEWAENHPREPLAQEIRDAPAHRLALAQSLARLIDSIEIEEASFADFQDLFGQELSAHREAILGFLDIVRRRLPEELIGRGLLGPTERRGKLIDLAGRRLAERPPTYPVIAAGSSGSIPATARLIGTIAGLEHGAAVLPGLDRDLDDASWEAISETHPQFALKRLLGVLKIARGEVEPLPGLERPNAARTWLARETMRPKDLTGAWQAVVATEAGKIAEGAEGLRVVAARTQAEEAEAIALLMREALETPGKTAALITPDRQLAARVRAVLTRWNIVADDTGGEPLIASAPGSFLAALVDAALSNLAPVPLAGLLQHRLLRHHAGAARHFELAILRGRVVAMGGSFHEAAAQARQRIEADTHLHPAVARIAANDWEAILDFSAMLDRALGPLRAHIEKREAMALAAHLDALLGAAAALAENFATSNDDAGHALHSLADEMRAASEFHPAGDFGAFATALQDQLRKRVVRARYGTHPRLKIYGLLEARLMHADLVILGGLNEGKWPAQPDLGPWLNRPMRETLKLMAPERDIGLTAHDFVQAFGNADVVLTWSARVGGEPAIPSRWILRLKLLLEAVDKWQELHRSPWLGLARNLDQPTEVSPVAKPAPRPPRAARPKRLSISKVEELIRDPYAIYARQVLRLEPLEDLGAAADARLRGELIHRVLELYHRRYPAAPPPDIEAALHEVGDEVFAPYRGEAEVAAIWLPRFARIAAWFAEYDRALRQDVREIKAECDADHAMTIAGEPFRLTGRADRIDLLTDGSARILDFKTGQAPGKREVEIGLSPQLTLEAALLANGAFADIGATKTSNIAYVRLTGGVPAGNVVAFGDDKTNVMTWAERHLEKLKELLACYADPATPYLPRRIPKREEDESRFDHLSRWREWASSAVRP
jgi:ATP-dependent helicase/nuclease subunit B